MPKLDTPTGLGLTDPEAGRESDSLRITFDPVAEATRYVLSLDGVPWPAPVLPGELIAPLPANTVHAMSLVAQADGFDDSDPSAPVAALTRPPVPSSLRRVPIDLNGWGIVLEWDEPGTWNGAGAASVLLRRSDDGQRPAIVARAGLAHRHIDTRYPLNGEKSYDALIAAPNPLGGPDNLSRAGPSVSARGPLHAIATGTANEPLAASRQRGERLARALLGLRY